MQTKALFAARASQRELFVALTSKDFMAAIRDTRTLAARHLLEGAPGLKAVVAFHVLFWNLPFILWSCIFRNNDFLREVTTKPYGVEATWPHEDPMSVLHECV